MFWHPNHAISPNNMFFLLEPSYQECSPHNIDLSMDQPANSYCYLFLIFDDSSPKLIKMIINCINIENTNIIHIRSNHSWTLLSSWKDLSILLPLLHVFVLFFVSTLFLIALHDDWNLYLQIIGIVHLLSALPCLHRFYLEYFAYVPELLWIIPLGSLPCSSSQLL